MIRYVIRNVATLVLLTLLGAGCSSAPAPDGTNHGGASPAQEHLVGKHPPGKTPMTLAHGAVHGRTWALISYTDAYGAQCVTVRYAQLEAIPACDIAVSTALPVNAAIQRLDGHLAVLYGRVGDTVEKLSAESSGHWQRQPIQRDPASGQRYFAVFILDQSVNDVEGVTADGKRYSLRSSLQDFFSAS